MIMITGGTEREVMQRALLAGATDFLTRPVEVAELRARVGNLLALRMSLINPHDKAARLAHDVELAARESLAREHERIILRLSRLSRCRNEETGNHMRRVAHVAALVASELGMQAAFCEVIFQAAPMHDIGKVGIPDRILLKPGRLTPEEWEIMKTHTVIGYEVLKDSISPLLKMGAVIAYSHHEKFDGSGYPRGLSGEAIPIEGRIVAVADHLDALLSARPYKSSWRLEDAVELMRRHRGSHFDPACVDALLRNLDAVLEVLRKYADDDTPARGAV